MEIIKERTDMQISRHNGRVYYKALTPTGKRELTNEYEMLEKLEPWGFVPRILETYLDSNQPVKLGVSDVGDNQLVTDEYTFRTEFTHMLYSFAYEGIIHGDLTSPNIRIVNNVPKVVDWKEAVYIGGDRSPKRPEGDAFHAFEFLASLVDSARIGRRINAMWKEVLKAEYSRRVPYVEFEKHVWLDFGCYHGDIAALIAATNIWHVVGYDKDHRAISEARKRFASMPVEFIVEDAIQHRERMAAHVISLLSTFPYMVNQHGWGEAESFVNRCVDASDVFFFESQLFGDGPGPVEFGTKTDVENWLWERGAKEVKEIITIPLYDRNTARTTFMVT